MTDATAGRSDEQTLLEAAVAILEPLAGLLLSQQIRHAKAEELLKMAYLHASARAYAAQGKVPTVSNLTVATGIRRREVSRLLENANELTKSTSARQVSPASQARLLWTTHPEFLDASGHPIPLARSPVNEAKSFSDLAARVSKDTHARALLEELLRIGAVEADGDFVRVRDQFLTPTRDLQGLLEIGGANVSDHLSTVLVNVLDSSTPLMERAIFADGLTERSAREGAALARSVWKNALPGLREKLQEAVDRDADVPENNWRVRIGIFGYLAPADRPSPKVAIKAKVDEPLPSVGLPRRSRSK